MRALLLLAFVCGLNTGWTKDSAFITKPVQLNTPGGTIYGTLLIPPGRAPIPLVLMISGSGPTDRDGNNPMMKNNSLRLLAEGLSSKGIATLRFDKRGVGASKAAMQQEAALRFDDYINDVLAWIAQLRQEKIYSKIIILGHSEGSLIGMIAAQKADGFISVAGAGFPADSILKRQLAAQPPLVRDLAFPMLDSLRAGHTVSNVKPFLYQLFRPGVQPYLISWFRYDPRIEIGKLNIPVLILQGTTDLQVEISDAASLHAAHPRARYKIIRDMNHVLKKVGTDRAANTKTYIEPGIPLHPELLPAIYKFYRKQIRIK